MILSTWNFEYTLAKFNAKYETDIFHYLRHLVSLFMLFAFQRSIFISQDRLNWLKQCCNLFTFVRFISSMESLSKG